MDKIYKKIRLAGGRITEVKKAILNALHKKHCLMSQKEIVKNLRQDKLKPNRSTIYRELQFLVKNGIINKSTISETDYYEIPLDHHHHLICIGCKSIKKIDLNDFLVKKETAISRENNFNIVNHSLEFYGYCKNCQKIKEKI